MIDFTTWPIWLQYIIAVIALVIIHDVVANTCNMIVKVVAILRSKATVTNEKE